MDSEINLYGTFMLRYSILLLYCFFAVGLLHSEFLNLSFQELHQPVDATRETIASLQTELSAFHQQNVKIRGFLYQGDGKQWILAAEPNLKTCCIGVPGKIGKQIVLAKPVLPEAPMHAVTVQGVFAIDPIWRADDSMQQLYRLDDPVLLNEPKPIWTWLALLTIAIVSCILLFLWIQFRAHSQLSRNLSIDN